MAPIRASVITAAAQTTSKVESFFLVYMQTTSLIRECVPIEGLVSIIDDYLCPANADAYSTGKYGHGERLVPSSVPSWFGVCEGGHVQLIESLIGRHTLDVPDGLAYACTGGHIPTVELLLSRCGGYVHSDMVANACQSSNVALVEMLVSRVELSLIDIDECMGIACIVGSLPVVKLLASLGAYNNADALESACIHGHAPVAALMIKLGADPKKCICRGKKHEMLHHPIQS